MIDGMELENDIKYILNYLFTVPNISHFYISHFVFLLSAQSLVRPLPWQSPDLYLHGCIIIQKILFSPKVFIGTQIT